MKLIFCLKDFLFKSILKVFSFSALLFFLTCFFFNFFCSSEFLFLLIWLLSKSKISTTVSNVQSVLTFSKLISKKFLFDESLLISIIPPSFGYIEAFKS